MTFGSRTNFQLGRTSGRRSNAATRGGFVLVVIMVLVSVLASLALLFADAARVDATATANQVAFAQADAAARGAVRAVLALGDELPAEGVPLASSDGQAVTAYYWIIRPEPNDDQIQGYGLSSEASKINLNVATRETLLRLPSMTEDLAGAIVDWRDGDDEPSVSGAESDHYLLESDPHAAKNGPFESVEELLLVRGMTPLLLYGEDTNRNGRLDANEDDANESHPPDNADGRLDRGLLDLLTVHTAEPNQDAQGERRVDLNRSSGNQLASLFGDVLEEERAEEVAAAAVSGRPFKNVMDFFFKADLEPEEIALVADRLATSRERQLSGLVNVNGAPRQVLAALPGLDESDADALIAARAAGDVDLSTIGWVMTVLDREKAIGIGGAITTRSYQEAADVVGLSGDGRRFVRYKVIMDRSEDPARILYFRDLSALGWPLDEEIRQQVRRGLSFAGPSTGSEFGGSSSSSSSGASRGLY